MPETLSIWLPDAESTHFAGASLAASIYGNRLTIGLSGELGAGKTSFLKGFLSALGVDEHVVSPTYALEQRYLSSKDEVLHIDLYRLNEDQAKELMEQSDEHDGIRCVEWVERSPSLHQDIKITLSEESGKEGRNLSIEFDDIELPSEEDIRAWREELHLPDHIGKHCDAVASLCETFAEILIKRGEVVRRKALYTAALMHDLLRFIDFQPSGHPENGNESEEARAVWESIKDTYEGLGHEEACARFAIEHGYPELGEIIRPHGLTLPPPERTTIEQKVLYYADKRVKQDEVVSLEQRFEDFTVRYGNGERSPEGKIWYKQAKQLETELDLT